jgi:tetratricopeptide (TPR) repeat protein
MKFQKTAICLILAFILSFAISVNLSYGAEKYFEKGLADFKSENYEEALESFEKAMRQQPDSSITAFYLGLTCKQMGDYRKSAGHLRNALAIKPPIQDAYIELIEVLYNLNELKEAGEWIDRAEKEGIKPAHTEFLKGLILSKKGKEQDAINAFSKARESDSTFSQISDFQIGMAYLRENKTDEARKSFNSVITSDPSSDLAAFARDYERSMGKTVQVKKAWRFSAGFAYQYDDNVVLKPSTTIPGVEITGEKDSSITTTIGAVYSPVFNSPWVFSAQYNLYANTYFKTDSHNLITQTLSLVPGYQFRQSALTLPVSYNHAWLNGKGYMGIASAKPTINMLFFSRHIGQISAGYSRREMATTPLSEDENRTAAVFSGSAGYLYPFSENKGIFTIRYEFTKDDTEGKNWDNTGQRMNFGLVMPVTKSVSMLMSGDILYEDYTNNHTVFGLKREDRTYSGMAGLKWELLKDLLLNLRYSHTKADSNIVLYEYKRNVLMAGLEYVF